MNNDTQNNQPEILPFENDSIFLSMPPETQKVFRNVYQINSEKNDTYTHKLLDLL
jgi:hypothetical protein